MIILYIFLGLLGLLLLIMIVPVRYRIDMTIGTARHMQADISWLFRLFHANIAFSSGKPSVVNIRIAGWLMDRHKPSKKSSGKKSSTGKKADVVKRKNVKKNTKNNTSNNEKHDGLVDKWNLVKALLTYADLKIIMGLFLRFIQKTYYALKPAFIDVEGIIGLSDPYATGLFMGMYETVAGILNVRRSIRIQGEFAHPVIQMKLKVAGAVSLISILWPIVWLCSRRPVFTLILKYIKKDQRKDESNG